MSKPVSFSFPREFTKALLLEAEAQETKKSRLVFAVVGPLLAKSQAVHKKYPEFRKWFEFEMQRRNGGEG